MRKLGDTLNSTTQTETQPYNHQLSEGNEMKFDLSENNVDWVLWGVKFSNFHLNQ